MQSHATRNQPTQSQPSWKRRSQRSGGKWELLLTICSGRKMHTFDKILAEIYASRECSQETRTWPASNPRAEGPERTVGTAWVTEKGTTSFAARAGREPDLFLAGRHETRGACHKCDSVTHLGAIWVKGNWDTRSLGYMCPTEPGVRSPKSDHNSIDFSSYVN